MSPLTAESLAATLALIGIVIMVSALLSGLIERSGLPQVAAFLGLGAALGPAGLGVLHVSLDSPILRAVATLSLTLVLFTDAVSLNVAEVRRKRLLALRVLGPGTFLSTFIIGLAGWWLLDLPAAAAAILGAALASTDPVLLRGLLRRRDIPADARHALQLESGLNDAVLLPVVILAMTLLKPGPPLDGAGWAKIGVNLFLLGPGAGILVGLLGVASLDLIRKHLGVRRDYESLYSLGVAFTAFAAAEAVHGSGFLAAFAAGMTIAALDVELCDCFVEYGEVTAEMLLLFTFVLFGSSLIWSGFTVVSAATLLFTALALLIRTPVYLLSLVGSDVDARSRRLIAWFGPRGLSSLLLILLPVFAGLPESRRWFALCSLVVIASVVLHGGSPLLLERSARRARKEREEADAADSAPPIGPVEGRRGGPVDPGEGGPVDPGEGGPVDPGEGGPADSPTRAPTGATPSDGATGDGTGESLVSGASVHTGQGGDLAREEPLQVGTEKITVEELGRLWRSGETVTVLDVRTERSLENSDLQARGAVRIPPDHAADRAREAGLGKESWLIAYCT